MNKTAAACWAAVGIALLAACGGDAGAPAQAAAGAADAVLEKTAMPTFGETHRGEATYYRATGEGNCSFEAGDDLLVVAVNTRDYARAALCGAYLAVTGPGGTVTVRVVDRCPGCKPGGLDLSRQAFERIAPLAAGRVAVRWQVVAGPVSGPVVYHYMDGSTRYWTALQVRNHRWPLAALEILPAGADQWLRLERRAYNYFVHPEPIAAGPLRVRLSAVTGAVLEDVLPEPAGGPPLPGAAQFPLDLPHEVTP